VAGEGEHRLVDGPQGDARGDRSVHLVAHLHAQLGARAGADLRGRLDGDLEPAVLEALAHRGGGPLDLRALARVGARRLDDGRVEIDGGGPGVVDLELEARRVVLEHQRVGLADAAAGEHEVAAGAGPGAAHGDLEGVAGLHVLAVDEHLEPLDRRGEPVIVGGCAVLRVDVKPGDGAGDPRAAGLAGARGQLVAAGLERGQGADRIGAGGRQVLPAGRDLLAAIDPPVEHALAARALVGALLPAAGDEQLDPRRGHPLAGDADGAQRHGHPRAGLERAPRRSDGEIEGRGVHGEAELGADLLQRGVEDRDADRAALRMAGLGGVAAVAQLAVPGRGDRGLGLEDPLAAAIEAAVALVGAAAGRSLAGVPDVLEARWSEALRPALRAPGDARHRHRAAEVVAGVHVDHRLLADEDVRTAGAGVDAELGHAIVLDLDRGRGCVTGEPRGHAVGAERRTGGHGQLGPELALGAGAGRVGGDDLRQGIDELEDDAGAGLEAAEVAARERGVDGRPADDADLLTGAIDAALGDHAGDQPLARAQRRGPGLVVSVAGVAAERELDVGVVVVGRVDDRELQRYRRVGVLPKPARGRRQELGRQREQAAGIGDAELEQPPLLPVEAGDPGPGDRCAAGQAQHLHARGGQRDGEDRPEVSEAKHAAHGPGQAIGGARAR
jgi:hypothetical protein